MRKTLCLLITASISILNGCIVLNHKDRDPEPIKPLYSYIEANQTTQDSYSQTYQSAYQGQENRLSSDKYTQ